jgi:L,D-peptidoglycan transpeptidase YkuD (ErfK/YbiS/YcfS/YnhG family)
MLGSKRFLEKIVSVRLRTLHVRALSPASRNGILIAGNITVRCTLGRSGRRFSKREGDGATPRGVWGLREVLHRPGLRVKTGLRRRELRPRDGWCDEPGDRNYNRRVKRPYPASHELLCREDELYDIVVPLGFNDGPRRRGGGSAIFFHLAAADGGPTAGCVAVSRRDMLKVLPLCGPRTRMKVW